MSLGYTTCSFALASVITPGTSVAPSLPPPDNCHTILIRNTSLTLVGLWGLGTAPAALSDGVNGQSLGPGATLTLAPGQLRYRDPLDESVTPGSGLLFDAIGGAIFFSLCYVCRIGSPD